MSKGLDPLLDPLLEQLATNLGTTTEYLWSALVRQAPITAKLHLVLLGLWILCCLVITLFVRAKLNSGTWEEVDFEVKPVAWILVGICWFIAVVAILAASGDIVPGLLNPEYWALSRILHEIK